MKKTIGFALCGSYCTHKKALESLALLVEEYQVVPIVSHEVAKTDTRFGEAHHLMHELSRLCDRKVISTIPEAEPLGPQKMLDLLVIAPCTGNTLGKLACGIADTPVTLGAKAHLRNGNPLLIAPSTNDGLAVSAVNIGQLLGRRHVYFVPFGQDDPVEKPDSLVSDFSRLPLAVKEALEGKQVQPVLI
ncbi:MAG: dipicolinate synthase subunit B [Eubacteriales bacterium]